MCGSVEVGQCGFGDAPGAAVADVTGGGIDIVLRCQDLAPRAWPCFGPSCVDIEHPSTGMGETATKSNATKC